MLCFCRPYKSLCHFLCRGVLLICFERLNLHIVTDTIKVCEALFKLDL